MKQSLAVMLVAFTVALTGPRPGAAQSAPDAAVISWLKANAIPLRTVEPGNDLRDLEPLRDALAGVRIVGLGEASHGSHELFQAKRRLIEFLVRKMGFQVLAMELDYVSAQAINDYVLGGGDQQDFILKPWDTEEVIALFGWLRGYNATQPDSAKVTVVGIDGQNRRSRNDTLLAYLRRAAPERAVQAESLFSDTTFPGRLEPATNATLQQGYVDLYLYMDLNGARLISASSVPEYKAMLEVARAFVQPGYIYASDIDNRESVGRRDSYMAENFRRLVARSPEGTRFILWAHNGHVEVSDDYYTSMGTFLRKLYGDGYYALGLTFDHGTIQAWDRTMAREGKFVLRTYSLHPAVAGTLESYLRQSGFRQFLIDFRTPVKPPAVTAWLTSAHDMRSIGAIYSEEGEGKSFAPRAPGVAFDGVLFVDATTRARPTARMRDAYPEQRD